MVDNVRLLIQLPEKPSWRSLLSNDPFFYPTEFVPRRDLVNKLLKQLGDQKKFMQELKAEHAGTSAEQLEQSLDQLRCPSHSIQIQAETLWNNAEYAQLLLGTL